MIEIVAAPDHVLAYRYSGTLTAEDYDRVIEVLEDKLRRHAKIGVYADMTAFAGLTLEALAHDLRYSLSKLGQLERYHRAALVTDNAWLRGLTTMAATIFPMIEARAFEANEAEAALAWASEPA